MRIFPAILFFGLSLMLPAVAPAVEFHGVFSTHHAGKTDLESASGDFLEAEERAQLRVSGGDGGAGFLGKIDLFHGDVSGRTGFEIREGYLEYGAGALDLRLGRQVITWGVGDLLFINDLFPKDYPAFFLGRNPEYLKGPISALKASVYSAIASVDLAVIPFFEPNRLPGPPAFQVRDPFPGIPERTVILPEKRWDNSELALRVSRPLLSWDIAAYGYRGYFRSPSMQPDSWSSPTRLDYVFPQLSALGMSAQGGGLGGVLSFEAGYLFSPDDAGGDDPSKPNSETRFLAGYQFAPWTDFTAGIQYYGELMMEYSGYASGLPPGFPAEDELRQVLSLRLTRFLKYQTLKLSFVAFYSPTNKDYYLIPEVSYRVSDGLAVALGGNIFGGEKDNTDFAMMDANDNIYLGLRFEF